MKVLMQRTAQGRLGQERHEVVQPDELGVEQGPAGEGEVERGEGRDREQDDEDDRRPVGRTTGDTGCAASVAGRAGARRLWWRERRSLTPSGLR